MTETLIWYAKKATYFIKSNHSNLGVTLTLSITIIDRHLPVRVPQYSRHRDLIVFSVLLYFNTPHVL